MDSTLSMNSIPITIASDAPSPHSLGVFSFDEADEFFWDRAAGRYRYKTGAAKGQFAPREAVLALTRTNLELRSQELVALGDRLSSGAITTRQFQSQAGTLLKRIHLQSAILGSGGVDKMDSADFLRVARTLKTQYYAGKDPETGKRYGLKHLTQELLDGKVSEAQLKARLQMYAQSGNLSYWAAVVKTEQGAKPFGVRTLGAAEHCEDCVAYANMPPRPITELPLPGMNCRCRMNCKCSIVPLTLEQAVARGLTTSPIPGRAAETKPATENPKVPVVPPPEKAKQSPTLPKDVTVQTTMGTRSYNTEVAGRKVRFSVSPTSDDILAALFDTDGTKATEGEVLFSIGGSLDKKGLLTGSDANVAAVKILRIMKFDISTRPEGFIYSTHAWSADGFGGDRERLYQKVGFSAPKPGTGTMYAIVKDGKLIPYEK